MAQVFTKEPLLQSARDTDSGESCSTRAQSDSSAEDSTWACKPQICPATRSMEPGGARRSSRCRCARKRATCAQGRRIAGG